MPLPGVLCRGYMGCAGNCDILPPYEPFDWWCMRSRWAPGLCVLVRIGSSCMGDPDWDRGMLPSFRWAGMPGTAGTGVELLFLRGFSGMLMSGVL